MAHPRRGSWTLVASGCVAAMALGAACASQLPSHDGYPEGQGEPWTEARDLELDDRGEAEIVDAISYEARERARWYAVELPAPGDLRARLSPVTFGRDHPAELGIELYDESFQLLSAGEGRESGGELTRDVSELEPGRHYVHVYATERDGVADFSLRLLYEQKGGVGSEAFPDNVAFADALPAVPEVDDTPQRRQRRARQRRPPPQREARPEPVAARIAGITVTDQGTRIRINRGGNHGITEGWRGVVTSSGGRPIPDGRFTVDQVTAREAFGTVSASIDAVTSARHVRLEPP